LSPYVGEYLAAIDRTQEFGFEAPPRLLVKNNCVDMQTLRPVLLDFLPISPRTAKRFDLSPDAGRTEFLS
jgi:hypothetical protein